MKAMKKDILKILCLCLILSCTEQPDKPTVSTLPSPVQTGLQSPSPIPVLSSNPEIPKENDNIISSQPSAEPSPESEKIEDALPTPSPSIEPEAPKPSPSIAPDPTPTVYHGSPSPVPFIDSKPLQIPSYTGECDVTEERDEIKAANETTLTGQVVDEDNKGVPNVSIRIKSLTPCIPYGAEVLTNENGKYMFAKALANYPVELEVAAPYQPSAFYRTQLRTNEESLPETNYFPFRVNNFELMSCIALAPSLLDVSGKISFDETDIPPESEALIHLRSLDGCSSYDKMVSTKDQAYFLNVYSLGSYGHLTISFPGRPTEVRKIIINSNKQKLPNVNVHNISLTASPSVWPELNPVWTPGQIYPSGTTHLE